MTAAIERAKQYTETKLEALKARFASVELPDDVALIVERNTRYRLAATLTRPYPR